jgi:hypothetical protein
MGDKSMSVHRLKIHLRIKILLGRESIELNFSQAWGSLKCLKSQNQDP